MRLIDGDALEKEGWSLHRTIRVDKNTSEYQTKPIAKVPTIEPVRKGKWIPLQLSMAHPPYQCSCCFRNAPMVEAGCLVNRHLEALLTDWCPWCGAKMGEGEQE